MLGGEVAAAALAAAHRLGKVLELCALAPLPEQDRERHGIFPGLVSAPALEQDPVATSGNCSQRVESAKPHAARVERTRNAGQETMVWTETSERRVRSHDQFGSRSDFLEILRELP